MCVRVLIVGGSINKIVHNVLISRDKQRQSTKFSSASYVIGLIVYLLITFKEFEVIFFFYWGTNPLLKSCSVHIPLTLPLPYPLTWGISSEYDCVKNLGCGMKIKFIKNCRVCFRILENAWRAFSFILVIIVDLRWLITVFRWHHCLYKLGHFLQLKAFTGRNWCN